MNAIRILLAAIFLPTAVLSAAQTDAPSQEQVEQAESTEQAQKTTQEVTVNGVGITFIVLAIGGILFATLQDGGSIAH